MLSKVINEVINENNQIKQVMREWEDKRHQETEREAQSTE
jgi:hypothetical protein